ncbi:MAG: hypothetical protein Q4F56_00055 [Candidatus Saccharibacteria bacterium]|nr:hypothetical protein [Candidatus Saccharibacteria bacterium]
MLSKIPKSSYVIIGLIMLGISSGAATASATTLNSLGVWSTANLSSQYIDVFSQNNINGWNPSECIPKEGGGTNPISGAGTCFKIDSSVGAQDFWYAEGCLNNGTCTSGIYAEGMSLLMTDNNPFLYSVTKTDDSFGGMQYIYADNYDINHDGAYSKLTENGGNSTRKYYWIVLPDTAYMVTSGYLCCNL